jgi:hypothetical protein
MSTLGKALAMPECRYTLRDLPRAPNMSTTGRTLHLITEVVRGLMARVLVEELAAAFPDHKDECPRVLPYVIDGLGMPGTHTRLVKQAFQGDSTIADIQSCASGARVAWDTLYLLEMYGALAWQPAEPKSDSRASMAATPEQLLAALEAKDHFAVLGLHWSCSPTEIEPAYEKLKGELGPSGTRRVPSKDIADAMWRRVEGAHRVLSDTAMRKRYRQATFNRIWPTEAAQLVTKARLALYRRDLVEARTTLLAAQDLAHTVEGTELLAMITRNEG